MPAYDIRSISQVGTYEPFELQVGRGQIPGHSAIHIFGHNPDVDATEVTVWPATGLLTHPTSATVMKVSSSSANDASGGTGARTLYIRGINGTGGYATETVVLTGQTAVLTTNSYVSVENAVVMSVGSTEKNEGVIYVGDGVVTAGVPATVYSAVGVGDNMALVGHWMCPTGYTGYLVRGSISTGNSSGNQYVTGRLKLRGLDNIIRTAAVTTVSNGTASYDFEYPVKVQAGECITATAKGTGTNNDVSSYFQIVLIQERGPL